MAVSHKTRLFRMFPQGNPIAFTTSRGKTQSAAVGSFLDVLEHDAQGMAAAGWTLACEVGPTSNRPTPGLASDVAITIQLRSGYKFYDTSLSKMIIWNPGRGIWVDETNTAV